MVNNLCRFIDLLISVILPWEQADFEAENYKHGQENNKLFPSGGELMVLHQIIPKLPNQLRVFVKSNVIGRFIGRVNIHRFYWLNYTERVKISKTRWL